MGQSNGNADPASIQSIKLDRPVTLIGGIALVIGGVIGMGIFALIAAVGAQAGTSLWVAFALAIVISIVGVAPLIQIASAMPRAGGGYLYTSRLLNPLLGTVTSSWVILGGACSTAMVSVGLSGYIVPYLPWDIPARIVAVLLPVVFYILYLFGLKLATSLQALLAVQLIIALMVYGITGVIKNDISVELALPQGAGGFIMATILCYSICMGFQVIAEMGEEMVDARRNIPLSLLIGGIIVLVIYILVGIVFINTVPYDPDTISKMKAPLMDTGKLFLPGFWVFFLSLGAVSAGLTSFNAGAIALPREFFSMARDGVMPGFLGRLGKKSRTPLNAVGVYFLFTVFVILLYRSIDFYGVMTAVGILMMTSVVAIAAVRLPKKYPDRYEGAYFKMSKFWLVAAAVISVLSCLGFILIVLMELPVAGLIYLAWTIAVSLYYTWRVRTLKNKGFDWSDRINNLPGFDEK